MGARHSQVRHANVGGLLSIVMIAALAACADRSSHLRGELVQIGGDQTKLLAGRHLGPPVVAGNSGPKRYVDALHAEFDLEASMKTVAFIDRFYRAPANDGYEAVFDQLASILRENGFGATEGFELEVIETPLTERSAGGAERVPVRAWTPLSGKIALVSTSGVERTLHSFQTPEGRDRTMLPINAPDCDLDAGIALELSDLDPGEILVTSAPPLNSLLGRAREFGAVGVISANLEHYNTDPSGKFRHLDAVQFRKVTHGSTLPVAMISQRSLQVIRAALDADPAVRLKFAARVKFDERPLRTLCATIRGTDRANEAIATVSHIQEPGACDNASGVAGLLESALGLARAIRAGTIDRPSRSLVFLWGDEFRQSSVWLESTRLVPVAGLSSDMTGESKEKTGAIALLERMPDPGGVEPFVPDVHTPWGRVPVDETKLAPNGVAVIARCAMLDVADLEGGWDTADHPYEGGSDHDEFIARDLPAALFWHFTDFAYHTSLDRMEHVDASEIRRTGVALMATALALADPRPEDLDRYLRSNNEERKVRVEAALAGQRPDIAELWRQWTDGARHWLRRECLRIPADQ